uniref:Uncharacterized protein n=1 Tax=Oryza rufipogon TaxID=4529 RepID=A0A0E0PPF1_ORYRU
MGDVDRFGPLRSPLVRSPAATKCHRLTRAPPPHVAGCHSSFLGQSEPSTTSPYYTRSFPVAHSSYLAAVRRNLSNFVRRPIARRSPVLSSAVGKDLQRLGEEEKGHPWSLEGEEMSIALEMMEAEREMDKRRNQRWMGSGA